MAGGDVLTALRDDSVAKIEMIDEVEELNLVLEHYAITFGVLCPATDSSNSEVDESRNRKLEFALRD